MKLLSKDLKRYRDLQLKKQKGICPICGLYIEPKDAVLDHCHDSGHCRMVLHNGCNQYEGRVKKAFSRCIGFQKGLVRDMVLKNLLKYILSDFSKNPIHPTELTEHERELKRINKRIKGLKRESSVLQYKHRATELRKLIKEEREKNSWKNLKDQEKNNR